MAEGAGEAALPSTDTTQPVGDVTSASVSRAAMSGPPEKIGHFDVERQIGVGAMGVVYAGRDADLNRKVAIKVLHEPSQIRLRREAQALAKLDHPNVVQVYEVGDSPHGVYVAMQLVEGQTLGGWLQSERRSWQAIVETFMAAGEGLAAAHAKNLVHGDFKPDNVLVGIDGVPRVVDFGLARRSGKGTAALDISNHTADVLSSPLTASQSGVGTPAYMAPEQYMGLEASERSDQFSFCVALWEALYGARPYQGKTPAAIAFAIGNEEIAAASEDLGVPKWVELALRRGLARDPDERFENLPALLRELGSYRDTTLGVGRRARVLFVALSCLVVLPLIGGASLAVRVFGVELDFQLAMFLSVASVAGIGAALHLLREPMTRSGMSEQLYRTFIAYLGFGPAMRLAGGYLEVPIPKVLLLELIGTWLFGVMVALGFDRRLLKLMLPFAGYVVVAFLLPSWALELHTLGHVLLFGAAGLLWVRDGFGLPAAERS